MLVALSLIPLVRPTYRLWRPAAVAVALIGAVLRLQRPHRGPRRTLSLPHRDGRQPAKLWRRNGAGKSGRDARVAPAVVEGHRRLHGDGPVLSDRQGVWDQPRRRRRLPGRQGRVSAAQPAQWAPEHSRPRRGSGIPPLGGDAARLYGGTRSGRTGACGKAGRSGGRGSISGSSRTGWPSRSTPASKSRSKGRTAASGFWSLFGFGMAALEAQRRVWQRHRTERRVPESTRARGELAVEHPPYAGGYRPEYAA